MKKITFTLKVEAEPNTISLMKEIDKISCRINLDLEHNIIIVENVSDGMLEDVVDLVKKYYSISNIHIDNILSGANNEMEAQLSDSSSKYRWVFDTNFEGKCLKPIIKDIINRSEKILATSGDSESQISKFIASSRDDLSYNYFIGESVKFSIGDIVSCNYGKHLLGEPFGFDLYSIVGNISKTGMPYLIPLGRLNYGNESTFILNPDSDIEKIDSHINICTKLYLDRARYVNAKRVNKVIGSVKSEFLQRLLIAVTDNYNFVNSDSTIKSNDTVTKESFFEVLRVNKKLLRDSERAIFEAISPKLTVLDTNTPVYKQLDTFLEAIGMPVDNELVKQSFVVAPSLPKISGPVLSTTLKLQDANFAKIDVQARLRAVSRNWLVGYPKLAEDFSKISFCTLLRVYVKVFCK